MPEDDEGWVSHDSSKKGRDREKEEDDSIELDSKEYEEWRRGTDNDSYMSDPKYFGGTTQDSTPVAGSDRSGDDLFSDRNIIIAVVVVVLLLIGSGLLGIYLYIQNSEDVASWPTVEGMVLETYYEDGFDEECTDDNDDGYYDDHECTETFWCEIKVIYNFTADNRTYSNTEVVDGYMAKTICQDELEGRYAINGNVTVHYNPDKPDENYIKNEPGSVAPFILCCLPIGVVIIILVIFSWVSNIGRQMTGIGMQRMGGMGWGFGGGFGRRMRSRRGRSPVRRSRTRSVRTRSRRR